MKVIRFMSIDELNKFINGKELVNNKRHEANTGSTGFCFLNEEEFEPEYAYKFLNGIVNADLCAEFETDEKNLNKSWGIYSDPYGSFFSTITITEYCTNKYSNKNFKLLRIAKIKYNSYNYEDEFSWYKDISLGMNELLKQKNEKDEKEEALNFLGKKKQEDFENFINELYKNGEIELKIGNKFYKFPTSVVNISADRFSPITLNLDIYIN